MSNNSTIKCPNCHHEFKLPKPSAGGSGTAEARHAEWKAKRRQVQKQLTQSLSQQKQQGGDCQRESLLTQDYENHSVIK